MFCRWKRGVARTRRPAHCWKRSCGPLNGPRWDFKGSTESTSATVILGISLKAPKRSLPVERPRLVPQRTYVLSLETWGCQVAGPGSLLEAKLWTPERFMVGLQAATVLLGISLRGPSALFPSYDKHSSTSTILFSSRSGSALHKLRTSISFAARAFCHCLPRAACFLFVFLSLPGPLLGFRRQ